jgi:hypothetical protein
MIWIIPIGLVVLAIAVAITWLSVAALSEVAVDSETDR